MGRFYRTADSPIIPNAMYSLNTPLMMKVIQANDSYIGDEMKAADAQAKLANFEHIDKDDPAAKQIIDNYTNQINAVTGAIQKDPINWRRQVPVMQNISKGLLADRTTGAISKYMGNYASRKAAFDQIDAQVQAYLKGKPGIRPDEAPAYKAYWDSKFTGTNYNPSTGDYTPYVGGVAPNDVDVQKKLSEGLDKLKASGVLREDPSQQGFYQISTTHGWEGVKPEQVLQTVMGKLNDPELQNYLQSRSEVGLLKGVYADKDVMNPDGTVKYKKGDFIQPYSNNDVPTTPEEQSKIDLEQSRIDNLKDRKQAAQDQDALDAYKQSVTGRKDFQWNEDSYLTPIIRGLTNQYSWNKTTDKTEVKTDEPKLQIYLNNARMANTNANAAADRQLKWNMFLMKNQTKASKGDADKAEDAIWKNNKLTPQQKVDQIALLRQGETFAAKPEAVYSPDQMKIKMRNYQEYLTALQNANIDPNSDDAPKYFNAKGSEEFQQLRGLFGKTAQGMGLTTDQFNDVAKMNNGDVLGSYYTDYLGNKYTKEQVDQRMKEQATGDYTGNFGERIAKNIGDQLGVRNKFTFVPSDRYTNAQANAKRALEIGKQNDSSLKDTGQQILSNTTMKDLYYYPNPQTTSGAVTYNTINSFITNGAIQRTYYSGNSRLFNQDGQQLSSDVEGKQNNPIESLVAKYGGKPTDYIRQMAVRPIGTNKFLLTGKLVDPKGKPINVSGGANDFQLVFNDLNSGLADAYGSSESFMKNPSARQFMAEFDDHYNAISNKVDYKLQDLTYKGQSVDINGTVKVRFGSNGGYEVSTDGGKSYTSTMKMSADSPAIPITSPMQVKAIVTGVTPDQ
jgi:hypothetical protein